jgi:flavodoxin
MVKPGEAGSLDLKAFDLLIVGSPTMGGRPSQPMQTFLSSIPVDVLKDKNVLAFDTRLKAGWVKVFGFAAEKIARSLTGKGGKLLAPPAGFIVLGSNGPLKEGELEKAGVWIKGIQTGKK